MIKDLEKEIEGIKAQFADEIKTILSKKDFIPLKDKYTSRKKGIVTTLMKRLQKCPQEERPLAGKLINSLKTEIEFQLNQVEASLVQDVKIETDYSLPEFKIRVGKPHILSSVRTRLEDIFLNMGYEIAYGPEVETEFHNFSALNFMEEHPARDEQDTFFIKNFKNLVLRTHTSPVQIRYMLKNTPPIKIISPGKVFRKDEPDATHTPVFSQIEGLLVDENIHFSHLKGTLELFIKSFFGQDVNIRFRPGFFPFTEPSAEVDISCFLCDGSDPGCRVCKGTGWLEILGSGMVHPQVLLNCNIDPDRYSGFAFGMGIERIAQLKYGINDLRLFYDNDLRFLDQFN
jgi:phenylalanyl-tRNA synthetase alpha chain